jgi:tetraacyldisaccharide-1-P 4'-kinase
VSASLGSDISVRVVGDEPQLAAEDAAVRTLLVPDTATDAAAAAAQRQFIWN